MDLLVPFWIKSIVFSMNINKFISQCRRMWPDIEFIVYKHGEDITTKLFIIIFSLKDINKTINLGHFPEIVRDYDQETIIQKIKELRSNL